VENNSSQPQTSTPELSPPRRAPSATRNPFNEPLALPPGQAASRALEIRRRIWALLAPLQQLRLAQEPVLDIQPGVLLLIIGIPVFWMGWGMYMGASGQALRPVVVGTTALLVAVLVALASFVHAALHPQPSSLSQGDTAMLNRWTRDYVESAERLTTSTMALAVVDDALWLSFVERLVLGRPQTYSERLIQAAALWELLLTPSNRQPVHELWAQSALFMRINTLHGLARRDLPRPVLSLQLGLNVKLFARFAALYDYFHAPGVLQEA